jgi:hypothetical protein
MVTNYYYKPSTKHEKGHISTSNIELGFKLAEFHRFWWICVSTGVYQEKEARYLGHRDKKHIPPRNQVEKDLEDMRRQPTEGGHTWHRARSADPTPGWLTLRGSHLSASSASRFSIALGFVASPLIQVGLIRGLQFIPPAYISRALPLGVKYLQVIWSSHQSQKPKFS